MMEREFITQKIKEYQIQEFVENSLGNVGHSHTVMKKTPLGEKIIIHASRPGLVVGRRGGNIKDLTKNLKKEFNLENPQIEINEVENIFLNPDIVAERIVSSLERFGTNRFKGIGHKMMQKIMESGARGVEIVISGKIPGSRARSWRFFQGYVKKCGDAAIVSVRKSIKCAHLKPGSIGIKVSIMPPGIRLPDDVKLKEIDEEIIVEDSKKNSEVQDEKAAEIKDDNVSSQDVKNDEKNEKVVEKKTKKTPKKRKAKKETSVEKSEVEVVEEKSEENKEKNEN